MSGIDLMGSPEIEEAAPASAAPEAQTKNGGERPVSKQDITLPSSPETPLGQPGYDYSTLPTEIRAEAKNTADEIKSLLRRSVIEVGAALSRIKDRLPHGQFGKWLSAEFGLTERTAQNYMNAAALASKSETVSVLRPKTLYLLASPSTPDSIRQTVIERFDAGESLPDSTVKEMIGEAKTRRKEEQRRAEEAAHEAKLSPRARRSRAQRKAELKREQQEWDRKSAEEDAAAEQAVDLLLSHLPPGATARLRELLRSCPVYKIAEAVADKLEEAGDPPAPNAEPPAGEAPVSDDTLEKIPLAAKRVMADDSLTTLQKQYMKVSDRLGAYDWVMRRLRLGETPETDDNSEVAEFVCCFIAAPDEIQKDFRIAIGERPVK